MRKDFSTLEIEVQNKKNSYFEHENYIAGMTPNLRGIYTTMYFQKPLKTTISTENIPLKNESPEIELSNFLIESFHFIQDFIKENSPIDIAVSQIVFNTTIGENSIDEISKMRAVRMLWAKMIHSFNPKNKDSYALKIQASINNPLNATTAILGGCQILASKTPHIYFEEESGILKTIDPWAGSTIIESKTEEISNKAWLLFKKQTNF